jgi:ankyrin repeat protein
MRSLVGYEYDWIRKHSNSMVRYFRGYPPRGDFFYHLMMQLFIKDSGLRSTSGYVPLIHLIVYFDLGKGFCHFIGRSDTDLNIRDKDGQTPLSIATQKGDITTLRILLEKDCVDVNSVDKAGKTPLHCSVHLSKVTKLLLENDRVKINSKTRPGLTALSLAARGGYVDTVKVLLKHVGVDIDSKCKSGATALSYVAGSASVVGYHRLGFSSETSRVEMAKALIECGAQVNSQDDFGRTPLVYAAMLGLKDVVDVLLEHGAVVDLPDNDGRTPLCWAAMKGTLETFNMLLERDADIGVGSRSFYLPTSSRDILTTNTKIIVR